MKHPTTELGDLASGALTPPQARAVHDHLANCDDCRMQWERLVVLEKRLAAMPRIEPIPDFIARVQARVAVLPAPQAGRLRWRLPAVLFFAGAGWIALLLITSGDTYLSMMQEAVRQAPAWTDPVAWAAWLDLWSTQFEATVVLALCIATVGVLLMVMQQLQSSGLQTTQPRLREQA